MNIIERIFITGVSPITLDSVTSGLALPANGCNISSNLSRDSRFNEMMGFTSEEIKYLISLVDHNVNIENTLQNMKAWYDG